MWLLKLIVAHRFFFCINDILECDKIAERLLKFLNEAIWKKRNGTSFNAGCMDEV